MQLSDKILKPIIETKYLHVENTDRYRTIIRFFYLQYEKLTYWMYAEEVLEELQQHEYFREYTLEQCQQDLNTLKEWRNLFAMQDTRKVTTIEEFKNKKFRYQLSEYSVEIERMVIRLENLQIEGNSLEPTLLERIREGIHKFDKIWTDEAEAVYGWWSTLNNDFISLNQNYQDYMRDLNSLKAEEMMKTKAFLVFKDKLIDYLRGFVKSLQYNVGKIEAFLQTVESEKLETVFEKILQYERSIPRLDYEISDDQIMERIKGRYESIRHWFSGGEGQAAEAETVFDLANDIIRKITRYAAQIGEQSGNSANRKSEYAKIAEMFYKCSDIRKAHCLSAEVFGFDAVMHLKGDFPRTTESINSGVYDEEPAAVRLVPRTRHYKEKSAKTPITDRSEEKKQAREAVLMRLEREKQMLDSYIKDGVLDFKNLPVIEPEVRGTFLVWLSKALENGGRTAKTENGLVYRVEEPKNHEYHVLRCTDGEFYMPEYRIIFS